MSATSTELKDFRDWLSPMLVKELRQGTRTRLFAGAFILLQAVLALTLLTSVQSANASDVSGIFWWILSITLFIIMPLRGFNALAGEQKLKTMDLILLTRLSAWRITFGKWAALVSQSALLVTSVLPYVVLRYFLGGVNVIIEIVWVFIMLVVSCVLTAIAVGLSAHKFFLIRALVALGIVFIGFSFAGAFYGIFFRSGELPFVDDVHAWLAVFGTLLVAAYLTYYLLDMGATLIAPAAENHATRKRLATFAILGFLMACGMMGVDEDLIFSVMAIIAGVAGIDALTETPNLLPGVLAPFVKRGWPGRLAGYGLAPGWHTAIFFFITLVTLLTLSAKFLDVFAIDDINEEFHVLISFAAMVAMPVAIVQLFFRKSEHLFALFLLALCVSTLFALLVYGVGSFSGGAPGAMWIGCFLPLLCLLVGTTESKLLEPFFICSTIILIGSLLILLVRAVPLFRRTREIEKSVASALREPAAEASSSE